MLERTTKAQLYAYLYGGAGDSLLHTMYQGLENLVTRLEEDPEYIPGAYGLCAIWGNSVGHREVSGRLVEAAARSWPYLWHRDKTYPVSGYAAYMHHKDEGTMWVGEQRKLRISLAKHVLSWMWFNHHEALRVLGED